MKIKKVKGYILSSSYGDGNVFGQPKGVKSIAIVEVHSDNNFIGYGETYAGVYSPELFKNTVKLLGDRIIGREINRQDDIIKALNIPFVSGSGFVRGVLGAIDIAIWDLKGQIEGKPVYKLLNTNFNNEVFVYGSGGSVIYTKEQIKDDVKYVKELGINHYKLRCGYQGLKKDLKRIETAIDTMDDNTIMVDFIQGTLNNMSKKEILYNLGVLNKFDLYWVEELVNPYDINLLQRIKEMSCNPIAMGEHLTNELEFRNMEPWVDYIQPDVTQCGGFYYTKKIMNTLKDSEFAMHCWGSSISFMANLNMAFSHPNTIMEYPLIELEINKHICKYDKIDLKGGTLLPYKFPGLGIYISDEVKEKYKFVKKSGYKI